jgi:hypothetical protein
LYKDRFDGYVTNTEDIMIRIVLNRRDVSGRTIKYMHRLEFEKEGIEREKERKDRYEVQVQSKEMSF